MCRAEGKKITVSFQIKGEGTKLLALKKAGETLNVLMPLGNGFFVAENEKKVALVGGGVGIFPIISVLREYAGKKELSAYIGFRNRGAVCGMEDLKRADRLLAVTDDGSFGEKMNAVQAFVRDLGAGYRPERGAFLRSSAHAPCVEGDFGREKHSLFRLLWKSAWAAESEPASYACAILRTESMRGYVKTVPSLIFGT